MKRSDMVDLLCKQLDLDFHERMDYGLPIKEQAERLLNLIEQAGMIPPLNKWEDYIWEPEE